MHFNDLVKLTRDNKGQQVRLNNLSTLIDKRINLSRSVINQIKEHKLTVEGKIAETDKTKIVGDNIRILFNGINKREYELYPIFLVIIINCMEFFN